MAGIQNAVVTCPSARAPLADCRGLIFCVHCAGRRQVVSGVYGKKANGQAYDGTGVGRAWPILTGERGHYELAAGRDPLPFIATLEKMANEGGMIAEQFWDEEPVPGGKLQYGAPTGSAMPLCWSHAEYLTLVRSRRDGVCFDRIDPAHERYVRSPNPHGDTSIRLV